MNATASGPVLSGRGSWKSRASVPVVLLLAGILAHGCSDNNGRVTPTSAQVTGDGIGGPGSISLFVQVTVNPATVDIGRRASVLVIVTNGNGFPLPGRKVQLTAVGGNLDATFGTTGPDGLFSTTMVIPCGSTPGIGQVVAIVEGVASTGAGPNFTTVTPTENNPCA
jgi:hypothetical protein